MKSGRDKDEVAPIDIDISLFEHRFYETTRGGVQTAYNAETLQQEVVLSSNMDGMSVGVTTMSLMR